MNNDKQLIAWIKQILCNDEVSTDEEIVELFMTEGPMTREEAEQWVSKRDQYLNILTIE